MSRVWGMKFVFYTNSVSAHQLPLAREIVSRIGAENYRYVYTGAWLQGGGQEVEECEPWIVSASDGRCADWLETCKVLLCDVRDIDLIERRAGKGLQTFYVSERWFKPIPLSDLRLFGYSIPICLPGCVRMLVPGYRRMAKRFVAWLKSDPKARYLAVGPWAKNDMRGQGVPEAKIVPWGYFVEKGLGVKRQEHGAGNFLRVLWVGRMLDWKRVDTIIRAVMTVEKRGEGEQRISLTLVGTGPEKGRLQKLVSKLQTSNLKHQTINFLSPVPIAEVRPLMRDHDVYVLASNAQEGWGAALNEALEEGMIGLGTHEAGASAALLPESQRFHAGDVAALARLLEDARDGALRSAGISVDYTATGAAERLMTYVVD